MKNTLTKKFFTVFSFAFVVLIFSQRTNAQNILSVTPNHTIAGKLKTTITANGNTFTAVTPFGCDFLNIGYYGSHFYPTTTEYIDPNHIITTWDISWPGAFYINLNYSSLPFTCQHVISGTVYNDLNANGTHQTNEPALAHQKLLFLPDSSVTYTDNNGKYYFYKDPYISYTIKPQPYSGWVITNASQYNNSYTSNWSTPTSYNIFLGLKEQTPTVSVLSSIVGQPVCNSNQDYRIHVLNNGTKNIDSGYVKFIIPSNTTYNNGTPTPLSVIGDTIIWNYSSFNCGRDTVFSANLHFPSSGNSIGEASATVFAKNIASGLSDTIILANDHVNACAGNPNNNFADHEIIHTATQPITYRINFRNPGTDTAINVIVYDTLSSLLNRKTFRMLASSHACVPEVSNNGTILFNLYHINLPDSVTNMNASGGWVEFQITPYPTLNPGDTIKNHATIRYDVDAPVVTNQSIVWYCLTNLSETHTPTTCGNTNGSIDLTVTGGQPPYNYLWSNGATTEDLTSLAQGIYTVTVTPCFAVLSVTIGNANGPVVTETHLSSTCANANGSIDLSVTSGTPPYTFSWSNAATTEDVSGLLPATYGVTVSDFYNCQAYNTIVVSDSNDLAITSTMHRFNCTNNASLYAVIVSGVAPYTYHWSNNTTADSLVNVLSGNYAVTVTDAGGCTQMQTLNPAFNSYIYFTSTPVLPGCSGTGSITATFTGGVPPYTYFWNNGETTASISGLTAGTYTLTVTDADGCTRSGTHNLYSSSSFSVIEGMVFNDMNGNCIYDAGDNPLSNINVHASSGSQNYYGYSNASGQYSIHVYATGTFNLYANTSSGSCGIITPCGATVDPIQISTLCDTVTGNNFGFTGSTGFDLTLHPGWSSANPGFEKEMWILYYYQSSNPFTDTATVTFHYDPNLQYDSSLAPIPIHDAVAHTLTWQVTNLVYGCCGTAWPIRLRNFFHVPVSLPLGYLLQSTFEISPTVGDCAPGNNVLSYSEVVTGSHDPNSKEVVPEGAIAQGDTVLTYKINFQNTGTAPTNFIIVTDTLPSTLDPTTVVNLASSHDYSSFDISGDGILTWTFNPLFLIDSFTNEPESNGFILFSIKRRPNLPFGTLIENTASVYFDYNEPVITNTVQSMVINSVNNISDRTVTVIASPNPFAESTEFIVEGVKGEYDFVLTNVLGEKVKELKHINAKQFTFNRYDLAQGIYFYKIVVEGKTIATGKVVAD